MLIRATGTIAIVGAGMAGLACADALAAAGFAVRLFDKGRGPGGRMSTRRIATSAGEASFDHGAQYFTVRNPDFARQVAKWVDAGVAQPWPLVSGDAWVGVPGMNAVVKDMAAGHDVTFSALVRCLMRDGDGWHVQTSDERHGPFIGLVLAIPSQQAAPLLGLHDLAMAQQAMHARSQPCWTAMAAFADPLPFADDLLRDAGPIAWAARNSAKPGRDGPEAWVIQASGAWSATRLEEDANRVLPDLLALFAQEAGIALPDPVAATAHRWRYAMSSGSDLGALWNPALALGACGDWLNGPRVECAWLSGAELGQRVAASMAATVSPARRDGQ